jgi:hypothetical protein
MDTITFNYRKCDTCKEWGNSQDYTHIEIDVEGILEEKDYITDLPSLEAETAELVEGITAYRYFWDKADIYRIASSQTIASVANCLCEECIRYSLSLIPHYGDGAYCTLNEGLKSVDVPKRVIHTHGVDIRGMNYRAIIKIMLPEKFKLIKKTAGVTKSVPLGQKLKMKQLVFAEKGSLRIIGFQEWKNNRWIDLVV